MMKYVNINLQKLRLIVVVLLLFSTAGSAQSKIDTVLAAVLKNNKSIQANVQYWESNKLQFKTGLLPDNPQVEYDYLFGTPENAGNQTEITAFQAFDFPAVYIKRNQLATQRIAQADLEVVSKRQEVLLNTKLVCIELVYRNKLSAEHIKRKSNAEALLKNFETRLTKGDGNILDVNKARLQLIAINQEYLENVSSINALNHQLVSLNGGIGIVLSDTIYFEIPDIPILDLLEKQIEDGDPVRQMLEQERLISQKEVELTRALSYPRFEAGYHYQGILGQKYNGIHTGITIPLFESKNTVKANKAKMLFADLELQNHKTEFYYEIKQKYERYQNLKTTLAEYHNALQTLNSNYLLNKALNAGQITSTEYFMEMNYYSNAFNMYFKLEKDYYMAIAELYKFTL